MHVKMYINMSPIVCAASVYLYKTLLKHSAPPKNFQAICCASEVNDGCEKGLAHNCTVTDDKYLIPHPHPSAFFFLINLSRKRS